ncbi:MAG TPA: hypothetical protein VFP34_08800 [Microlunatus sp.]|nr:hypothetical protein [Microlunatus sp.]
MSSQRRRRASGTSVDHVHRQMEEMGHCEYGGSSFALLFQKLPGKRLIFMSPTGDMYEKLPVLPKGSASTGGNVTTIGAHSVYGRTSTPRSTQPCRGRTQAT